MVGDKRKGQEKEQREGREEIAAREKEKSSPVRHRNIPTDIPVLPPSDR